MSKKSSQIAAIPHQSTDWRGNPPVEWENGTMCIKAPSPEGALRLSKKGFALF